MYKLIIGQDPSMKFKKQLKHYLAIRNISAAELARRSGVNKQSISNWLGGIEPKSFSHVKKLADALSVTVDELVFGDASRSSHESSQSHAEINEDCGLGYRFNQLTEIFCAVDTDGRLRDVSPAFCSLVRWCREELINRPLIQFVHTGDRLRTHAKISGPCDSSSLVEKFDTRILCRTGQFKWLRCSVLYATGDRFTIAICRDVTHEYMTEDDRLVSVSLNHLVDETVASIRAYTGGVGVSIDVHQRNQATIICRPHLLSASVVDLVHHVVHGKGDAKNHKIGILVSSDASRARIRLAMPSDLKLSFEKSLPGERWLRSNSAVLTIYQDEVISSLEIAIPTNPKN